jgi:hypothetical protein
MIEGTLHEPLPKGVNNISELSIENTVDDKDKPMIPTTPYLYKAAKRLDAEG